MITDLVSHTHTHTSYDWISFIVVWGVWCTIARAHAYVCGCVCERAKVDKTVNVFHVFFFYFLNKYISVFNALESHKYSCVIEIIFFSFCLLSSYSIKYDFLLLLGINCLMGQGDKYVYWSIHECAVQITWSMFWFYLNFRIILSITDFIDRFWT